MSMAHDYVESIQGNTLRLVLANVRVRPAARALGARRRGIFGFRWELRCESRADLAGQMAALRDLGVAFAGGPHGWPPAAVFEELRRERRLAGPFREITWRSPGHPVIREA